MANRKERRFIQHERMKEAGYRRINDPTHYDGINERYCSFFAMHWRHFPNLDIIPFVKRDKAKRILRDRKTGRKEVAYV